MLEIVNTSIFDSDAECLVNQVNCVGVMGKGLALEFKRRYPQMFHDYRVLCDKGDITPGKVYLIDTIDDPMHTICLFPTKDHWKNPSKLELIENGLQDFLRVTMYQDITSAAFPMLGCGLGGLNFEHQVLPLMVKYLSGSEMKITIHVHP